jgi:hypothetical protein
VKGLVTGVSVRKGKGDNPPIVKIVFEGFLNVEDLTMVVDAFNKDQPLQLGDGSIQVTPKMRLEAKGKPVTATFNAETRKNLDKALAQAEAEVAEEGEPDMGGEPAPKPRTALDDLADDMEM